jgi:thioesterase domain-containing protein
VQPHGPYTLIGHSAGGLVAYEMAQQLGGVEYLGMIDTSVIKDLLYRGDRFPLHRQVRNMLQFSFTELLQKLKRSEVPEGWLADGSSLDFWLAYQPQPYAGRVTLFKTTGLEGIRNQRMPVDRAWRGLTNDLTIHEVSGRHNSVIELPYVQGLATRLRESLNDRIRL